MTELDPLSLLARVRRTTGADTDRPVRFLDELTRLTTALDTEAKLTDAGRATARTALVNALAVQFHLDDLYAAHPEVANVPVRPVFITGLLRTGTSFLQAVLSHHPALRSPALWELMAPAGPGAPAELRAACRAYVAEYHRSAPGFAAMHPLDADAPEECHRLTANSFRDPIYALRYRIPSDTSWLRTRSMVPAYEFHREQLRAVLWRAPGDPVVLKCPSHLWHLDDLAAVYPDAKIVRMHRSPAVCLPSVSTLTAVVRGARASTVDKEEIGGYWFAEADRALFGLRRTEGVLDLRYADLVADPLGTAEQVCHHIGVEVDHTARAAMAAFIERDRAARPPSRGYVPEEFGLTRARLERHFADYIDAFALS